MFANKSKLAALKIEYDELEEELDEVRKELMLSRRDVSTISSSELSIQSAQKELEEVKKLVRKQNEADLLINALKAVGIIKDEKTTDYAAEAKRLVGIWQQLGAAQQQSLGAFGGLGLLGGLI